MRFPEYEGKAKVPVGHYKFRLNKEPELKTFDYTDRNGVGKQGKKIVLFAVGTSPAGDFPVSDAIIAWEPRYADLLAALHVEHGADIDVAGSVFEADIVYELDKKDPTKSYPRIVNIKPNDDIPQGDGLGDDIPF